MTDAHSGLSNKFIVEGQRFNLANRQYIDIYPLMVSALSSRLHVSCIMYVKDECMRLSMCMYVCVCRQEKKTTYLISLPEYLHA